MKIAAYSYRDFDEGPSFKKYCEKYDIELIAVSEPLTLDNVDKCIGCDGVSILYTICDRPLLEALVNNGIKRLSMRCIGYDFIDIKAAKELGIEVSNITYDISSVSEYTLMMMLMGLRRYKYIEKTSRVNNYTLPNKIGDSIQGATIGVIGTGAIGEKLINNLSGFDCKILAYDLYPKERLNQLCTYVDLDTLYKESDIITFHVPLLEENYHMVNVDTFKKMKDGVFIVNCARGGLIDTYALIDACKSGKVAAAMLDAIEDDAPLYFNNFEGKEINHPTLDKLRALDNVVVSPHMAWYTKGAVDDMVRNSLESIIDSCNGKENKFRIV